MCFFLPYYFLVYEPSDAPTDWLPVSCVVLDKETEENAPNSKSQIMYYVDFTLAYSFNTSGRVNGSYYGCHRYFAYQRDDCSTFYNVGMTYACRFDPYLLGQVVLSSDWLTQNSVVLIVLLGITSLIFVCCFMCFCVGILCSNRLKDRDVGYTILRL